MPDPRPDGALAKFTRNKPLFYGTLAALGLASVLYYRHRQAAAAADTADSSGTDTTAADSGSAYGTGTGGGYAGDPYGGGSYGTGGFSGTGGATGTDLTTREAWMAEAENILPNGHSATVRSALLGVLGGLTVSSSDRSVFLEAVGVLGDPPGGYPNPIRVHDTTGHPAPGKVTVPDVKGETFDRAQHRMVQAGLVPRKVKPDIHIVTGESPAAGSKVARGTTVHLSGHS